jgi:hypothetical protein
MGPGGATKVSSFSLANVPEVVETVVLAVESEVGAPEVIVVGSDVLVVVPDAAVPLSDDPHPAVANCPSNRASATNTNRSTICRSLVKRLATRGNMVSGVLP